MMPADIRFIVAITALVVLYLPTATRIAKAWLRDLKEALRE